MQSMVLLMVHNWKTLARKFYVITKKTGKVDASHLLFFYFFSGLLTACSHGETSGEIGYKMISEFSREAKKKYGLVLSGFGGKYGEKIKRININFDGYYEVDVPAARRLFVKAVIFWKR